MAEQFAEETDPSLAEGGASSVTSAGSATNADGQGAA